MNMNEIYAKVNEVYGWFSREQCETLLPFITSIKNGLLFEIGTYHGRSTLFFRLANPSLNILTIDLGKKTWTSLAPVSERIDEEVLRWGGIFQVRGDSKEIIKTFSMMIDFLFIDGAHEREPLMQDLAWTKFVRDGGFVAFHDYGGANVDVKPTVDKWLKDNPEFHVAVCRNELLVAQRLLSNGNGGVSI